MPGVAEVGVIGVPDDKTGEAVRAYVVPTTRRPPRPQVDRALPRAPRRVQGARAGASSVDELPKSPIGKILRSELRADRRSTCESTASHRITTGRELS